ncbi:MAG: FAD-binding protein, partial [Limibaculum sp.]
MAQPHDTLFDADGALIVGAGLAGLFTALKMAPHPVTVLSPMALGEGASSAWAQGGVAAALRDDDSPAAHARDTVAAGAGTVDPAVALSVA